MEYFLILMALVIFAFPVYWACFHIKISKEDIEDENVPTQIFHENDFVDVKMVGPVKLFIEGDDVGEVKGIVIDGKEVYKKDNCNFKFENRDVEFKNDLSLSKNEK